MKLPKLFKPAKVNYTNPIDFQTKIKKITQTVNTRFVVLGVVLALFMSALVGRLYQIQILDYRENLSLANRLQVKTNSALNPRGEIVDRNGVVMVTNQEVLNIVYSRPADETNAQIWAKAKAFTNLFEVSFDHFIRRDKQDAYLTYYPEEAKALITQEETDKYLANELSDSHLYQLQVDRVTDEMINQLTNQQLREYAVYQRMEVLPGLIKVIKEDVTAQEVAVLLDNIDIFKGFNVSTNWRRQYAPGIQIGGILGSLYTSKQGLPEESVNYYLANNYNLLDQVGRSGLEAQYESILSGEKMVYTIDYDKQGLANMVTINEGQKGATLRTTIDINYQNHMEQVVADFLKSREADPNFRFFNKLYLVISDPNTGDVLANLAMKRDSEGNYYNSSNSTYLDSYPVGSSIKGSVVYMGLDKDLVQPGEIIYDAPIKIAGTPEKSSYQNLGPVNDLTALSFSSNIYMFNVVIRLGNGTYQYNQPLYLKDGVADTMRYYFSMFGLGTPTQLDVNNEATGYKASSGFVGNYLDFAIGQYDTYTPMQLNQYISTIANGEYRYALRFVADAIDPKTGEVVFENNVRVLNGIDNQDAIARVQQGFRLCVTEGYCGTFRDAHLPTAAKTGTAQDIARDPVTDQIIRSETGEVYDVTTNTLVAYAPYDNPEVAVSCIAPFYAADRIVDNGCSLVVEEAINYHADNR